MLQAAPGRKPPIAINDVVVVDGYALPWADTRVVGQDEQFPVDTVFRRVFLSVDPGREPHQTAPDHPDLAQERTILSVRLIGTYRAGSGCAAWALGIAGYERVSW